MFRIETRLVGEIIYTHIDGNTGTETSISISQLTHLIEQEFSRDYYKRIQLAIIPLEKGMVNQIRQFAGIEPYRVKRIKRQHIVKYPIYIIQWEDGIHTICDGNHRVVKAYNLGFTEIRAIIILPELWRQCVLSMPPIPGDTFEEKTKNLHAIQFPKEALQ